MTDRGDRIEEVLRDLGASVEPPSRSELAWMARTAAATKPAATRRQRLWGRAPGRAAAAAAALAVAASVVVLTQPRSDSSGGGGTGGTESAFVRFPEGSALQLLLRNTQRRDGTS